MKGKRIYKADGSSWAGFPYRSDVTTNDAIAAGGSPGYNPANRVSSNYGRNIWDSIKGQINGWANTTFSGIRDIVGAANPAPVEDKTPTILAIAGVGVAAIILVIVLILAFRK